MQEFDYRTQIDAFRDRNVQIGAAVGLIVGLLLGWFVLGWWIAPVRWVDAGPGDLHPDWQEHYVAMVVDSFLISGDSQTAQDRLKGFEAAALGSVFGQVEAEFEQRGAARQAQATRQLADLLGVSVAPTVAPATPPTEASTPAGQPPSALATGIRGLLSRPLVRVCGLVLLAFIIIIGGVAGFFWYRSRTMEFAPGGDLGDQDARRPRSGPRIGSINLGGRSVIEYRGEGPTYEQTIQVYHGEEIIGSCGLRGVSTLSDGGRVVACAVWLYEPKVPERAADTCVLASRRVYQNEPLRNSLLHGRGPGEIIPAERGQTAHLEHETLEMMLRVIDVEYTDPGEQFISRLVVELEPATKRGEPGEPAPLDFA